MSGLIPDKIDCLRWFLREAKYRWVRGDLWWYKFDRDHTLLTSQDGRHHDSGWTEPDLYFLFEIAVGAYRIAHRNQPPATHPSTTNPSEASHREIEL